MVVVLATAAMSGFLCMLSAAAAAGAGEVLYNGIVLPALWPPRDIPLSTEPPPLPPYLVSPPAVIPIDVGRQLFVDDFLIEQTTLKRTWHLPVYYDKNPVITSGIPFSDGVWWDPNGQSFKMWYVGRAAAGDVSGTCYATSKDGLTWDKPALDLVKNRLGAGTNVLLTQSRDSGLVWLDPNATDPSQRFKMSQCDVSGHKWFLRLYASPDGIHWTQFGRSGQLGDRSTFFYNPFRKVWVFSIRDLGPASQELLRFRRYSENADFLAAAQWPDTATTCGIWHQRDLERAQAGGKPLQWDDVLSIAEGAAGRTELPVWAHADNLDPRSDDVGGESFPQLYNLDATPYESLMLGLFSIWRGGESVKTFSWHNEIFVGFSRDGFHWHRPAEARQPFLPRSNGRPERWNYTNVQSAGGGCLVMGDRLYFYCSGRSPVGNATGVAFLRRDGFASMDGGREGGSLTTRPVRFAGCRLFVNVDAANGELAAEILDEQGNVIAPFSRANCARAAGDSTLQPVNWKGAADLSSLAGRIVRFRFHLRQGKLYAFWVSPDASGASGGYVAAGGQGLTGPTDTVGEAAYRDIQPPLPHKTAPFLAKGSPRQAQKAGTTEVSISVRSDEPVVCRYALKAGVLFDKMDHAFTNTGGLLHTTKVSGLKDGAACTLYIKARDEAGNICED
jgi:hypothetical protein